MIGLDFFLNFHAREATLTLFDVGAHRGDSVRELLDLFPQSRIFAFEPARDNCAQFRERYASEGRVKLVAAAVGNKSGRVQLHINNYDATHSLLPFDGVEINRWADANDFCEEGIEEVDEISIDEFCSDHGVGMIDILKLDTQGGELLALQGAQRMLQAQSIGCIFCEVEFRSLYRNQPLFCDINAYLSAHKYHFVTLVSTKVSEMGILLWADAIYVNDRLWRSAAARHAAGKIID